MKKTLLKAAVFVLILTLGFSAVTAASFAADGGIKDSGDDVVTLDDTMFVKCGAFSNEVVKGLLLKGTKVTVADDSIGGWYRVTADELDGWVYGFRMGDTIVDGNSLSDEEKAMYEKEEARSELIGDILAYAETYLGKPYVYGATGPNGFDCSGLLYRVFGDYGISVPRSSRDYGYFGDTVSLENAKPGDVISFARKGGRIHHVGIYLGDDKFIHSASSEGVTITSIYDKYWQPRIYRVARIV